MKLKSSSLFFFILFFLFLSNSIVVANPSVLIVEMKDTIDQSSVELLKSAIKDAENQGDEVIILTLNTPGGGVAETFVIDRKSVV